MSSWRRSYFAALLMAFFFLVSGCGDGGKPQESSDILSQKTPDANKVRVTVLVKYAFSINEFEKAVEEKFPQVDIVQVGNFTPNFGRDEFAKRLEHDDLPDIVMTWPLDVGERYWKERLIDLSGLPFTSRYNTSQLNDIARDGHLYFLPGPSQIRGIIYNKTLFQERGWKVPRDFAGFVALCKEIENSGMRSLQLSLANEEVLDTPFVGFNFASSFSKPENLDWFTKYNAGKGSFGDNFGAALDTFQSLIDAGILKKEDLGLYYKDRETMIFSRQCAMAEDSVLMARMGAVQTGTTDEFALMPFFNPNGGEDWVRLYPVCFIGLNRHLQDAENKEKYELVMKLMEYISSPEGQKALSADTGAMLSALKGVSPPDLPETKDLGNALLHGRYGVFPILKNAQSALREGLAGMVAGRWGKDQVVRMVDAQNYSPPLPVPLPVLGKATETFSVMETGNFITDAMRRASGCEIALYLDNGKDGRSNGRGVGGKIYAGELNATDIMRIMSERNYRGVGKLWCVTMTGADLIKTLEYSILVDNGLTGWFYYFSGLRMEFAPAAEPGRRVRKITDTSGAPINPKRVYTVAVMADIVPEAFLISCEKTEALISDVVTDAIKEKKTIAPSKDGRFIVVAPR